MKSLTKGELSCLGKKIYISLSFPGCGCRASESGNRRAARQPAAEPESFMLSGAAGYCSAETYFSVDSLVVFAVSCPTCV